MATIPNPHPISSVYVSNVNAGSVNFSPTSSAATSATISASSSIGIIKGTSRSTSPELPPMYFQSIDENQVPVILTLQPESSISSAELMRLLMLLVAYSQDGDKFSVYAYVKTHNLERHFTFKY